MKSRARKNLDELELAQVLRDLDEAAEQGVIKDDTDLPTFVDSDLLDSNQLAEFRQANKCLWLLHGKRARLDETTEIGFETPNEDPDSWMGIEFGGAIPRRIGRFQIERELGRGGFGVVLLAHDPHLDRKVALKIPKPEALLTSESRARFEREAKSAAILGHPAIVPIYESGFVGPIHYIAFAYCHGVTLAQWMSEGREQINEQMAARIVAQLADAVQHAHTRGVIHRDLKPGNVLIHLPEAELSRNQPPDNDSRQAVAGLADDEQVIAGLRISDFGLAKTNATEISNATGTGALIGTPAYMSPEQARGDVSEIGFASDIHSLGVVLYELISGQRPFKGFNELATMQAVVNDEPMPPGKLRMGLSPDLEAICLKCLEKVPCDRYESAQSLADDLNRWLEGRPVLARRTPIAVRFSRWCHRNPVIALVSAVAILSVLLGSSLVTWQWLRAERNLKDARQQRDRAEKQIERTNRTIDRMVTNLSERAQFSPQLKPFKEQLLQQTIDLQRQMIEEFDQNDSRAELGVRKAEIRIARLQLQLGDLISAKRTCEDIQKRIEDLENGMLDGTWREIEASVHFVMGNIALKQHNFELSAEHSKKAITDFEQIIIATNNSSDAVLLLAKSQHQLGITHDLRGQLRLAEKSFNDSLATIDLLRGEQRTDLNVLEQQSASQNSLAIVSNKMGCLDDAESQYLKTIGVVDEILSRANTHVRFHAQKGSLYTNLGNLYLRQKRHDKAIESYRKSEEIFEQLTTDFSGVPEYYERLSTAAAGLGNALSKMGQLEDAKISLHKSIETSQKMREFGGSEIELHYLLGLAYTNLSVVFKKENLMEDAANALERAVSNKRALVNAVPDSVTYQNSLGTSFGILAKLHDAQGNTDLAVQNFREAIRYSTQALEIQPLNVGIRQNVAMLQRDMVCPLCRQKQYDESIAAGKQALELLPQEVGIYMAIVNRLVKCIQIIERESDFPDREKIKEKYCLTANKLLETAKKIDVNFVESTLARGGYEDILVLQTIVSDLP